MAALKKANKGGGAAAAGGAGGGAAATAVDLTGDDAGAATDAGPSLDDEIKGIEEEMADLEAFYKGKPARAKTQEAHQEQLKQKLGEKRKLRKEGKDPQQRVSNLSKDIDKLRAKNKRMGEDILADDLLIKEATERVTEKAIIVNRNEEKIAEMEAERRTIENARHAEMHGAQVPESFVQGLQHRLNVACTNAFVGAEHKVLADQMVVQFKQFELFAANLLAF